MEITFPISEFHLVFHYISQIKTADAASVPISVKFTRETFTAESL